MKTKRNFIITIIVLVIALILAFLYTFGNKILRKIPFVTVPYSKTEILKYLETNYNEKFEVSNESILKIDPNDQARNKDKVYIAYPINNDSVVFFVCDKYDYGHITLGDVEGPSRELSDTYTNALLLKDLPNLKGIYPDITVEEYNVHSESFASNLSFGSEIQSITLPFNNSYREVDKIADKFVEVYNYIYDNISKYKTSHTKINIETSGVYSDIDYRITNTQSIKDTIIGYLIREYRETKNSEIFSIPSYIKEKYPVRSIGYINELTKVFVNGELLDIDGRTTERSVFKNGDLQFDGLYALIPSIKSHFKSVDYNALNNITKIQEEIIYSYEKDNNIYILTNGKGWGVSIYKYENSDVVLIKEGWDALSSNELKEYFGITTSYDFEKEILHLDFQQ